MEQGMAPLGELIGRAGLVDMDGLDVRVVVLNFKSAYGTLRLLVTPVSGAGEKWIRMDRFHLDNGPDGAVRVGEARDGRS